MSQRTYSRRELMITAEEEVYDVNAKWKYDTYGLTVNGVKYLVELGWPGTNNGDGTISWNATSYTGYHKTLDVKAGQRYRIKTGSSFGTTIFFANTHVWREPPRFPGIQINLAPNVETIIEVPEGWQYMFFWFYQQTGERLRKPERISRLTAYG